MTRGQIGSLDLICMRLALTAPMPVSLAHNGMDAPILNGIKRAKVEVSAIHLTRMGASVALPFYEAQGREFTLLEPPPHWRFSCEPHGAKPQSER